MTHRADVGQGHAHAHTVNVILGPQADTGGLGVVHVRMVGVSGVRCGLEEGFLCRGPSLAGVVADGDRAVGAVEIVVEVGVVLQLAEVGQAVDVGPSLVARGGPSVVVLGCAPDEGLAVDGAGTSQHLAAGDGHGLLFGSGGAGERPVVGGAGGAGLEVHLTPAKLEHIRQLGKVREVRASLQQQH